MFTAPRIASKIETGHWEPRGTATHHPCSARVSDPAEGADRRSHAREGRPSVGRAGGVGRPAPRRGDLGGPGNVNRAADCLKNRDWTLGTSRHRNSSSVAGTFLFNRRNDFFERQVAQ